jgi:hypothetical protein
MRGLGAHRSKRPGARDFPTDGRDLASGRYTGQPPRETNEVAYGRC